MSFLVLPSASDYDVGKSVTCRSSTNLSSWCRGVATALGHARDTFSCTLVCLRLHWVDTEPLNVSSTPLLSVFFHLTSFIRFISTTSNSCALSFQHRLQEVCSIISYCLKKYHPFKQVQDRSDHHVSHLVLGDLKKFRFVQRNLHEQQTELAPTVLFAILSLFTNQLRKPSLCLQQRTLTLCAPSPPLHQASPAALRRTASTE